MKNHFLQAAEKLKRLIVLICFLFFLPAFQPFVYAGEFLSVPLNDPVYQMLESAQIRGLIERLPTAKPYSRAVVDNALEQLKQNEAELSRKEINIIHAFMDGESREKARDNSVLQTGALFYDSPYLSAEMGAWIESDSSLAVLKGENPFGTMDFLNLYLNGDMGVSDDPLDQILSYRFDMRFGVVSIDGIEHNGAKINALDQEAFAPYTFTPAWAGYSYSLLDPFNNVTGDEGLYIAFNMEPEISLSFFENQLQFGFSRVSRNWGLGEDSIILSGQASLFTALSLDAKIFDFIDYSFLAGTLENSQNFSEIDRHQSLISIHSVDVRPFEWLYLGVHESVVWPKRFELGYLNPMIFSSLYQGMIGDFDNILGGLSLGLSVPGYADVYGTFMVDEFSPASFSDMFTRVRNLFSYQVGMKAAIPKTQFGTLTLQYTKIEPFTYTHPVTDVPWMENSVYESFVSNAEGLPSKLDPNSDELLVQAEAFLHPAFKLTGSYQLIRHGEYGGDYNKPLDAYIGSSDENGILPEGMEYPELLEGDADSLNNLQKDFLRDGNYDWYHIAEIGCIIDFNMLMDLPLQCELTHSLVYHFMNDAEGQRIEAESSGFTNYIRLAVQVW